MAVEIRMPKLDMTMEEATIIRWLKQEGEKVEKGEPILEIMTEKVVMEVEAPASGILAGIKFGPDQVVPVGEVIAYILQPGEQLEEIILPKGEAAKPSLARELVHEEVREFPKSVLVRATPAARRLAREYGIDLSQVQPSGSHGEITEEDVREHLKRFSERSQPVSAEGKPPSFAEVITLKGWRKTIALRMQQSNEIPQISLTIEVDMSEAALRRGSCSFTSLIAYETARVLRKHPRLNSSLQEDKIVIYQDINLGIAVATDQGLIVPVIKNADQKSLEEIDSEIKELTRKAREGTLSLADISGGTFTITNLGMFGVDQFQALINPPQAAILAVGQIKEKPIVYKGQILARSVANFTVSADHRIVDGAEVALFLSDLKKALERPQPAVREVKQPVKVIVIGGGFGGYTAALRASEMGAQVTLIEKQKLGGTCVNKGCIPTKTFLEAARRLHCLNEISMHGITVQRWNFNFEVIQERKTQIIEKLVNSMEQRLKRANVNVIGGMARFLSPHKLAVIEPEGKVVELEADRIIIATGAEPITLPLLPDAITSTEALELKQVPKEILIIGGGVIGAEFACIFSFFGSKVTIVEATPKLLPTEDKDVSEYITRIFRSRGIQVLTQSTVRDKEGGTVIISTPEGERRFAVESVLVAVGRKPLVIELDLEKANVEIQGQGIKVNEYMETNVQSIYAAGDVTGRHFLAHVAAAEGKLAAENALGQKRPINYAAVPRCIFTIPEIASVGLTEEEALKQGGKVTTSIYPWTSVEKALIEGHTDGFVKIVAIDGLLAGLHIVGLGASNLIMEGVLAVNLGISLEQLTTMFHPHPTLSEAIQRACEKALSRIP